jgi:hypothetical protein
LREFFFFFFGGGRGKRAEFLFLYVRDDVVIVSIGDPLESGML